MLGLDALDEKLLARFCDDGALPNLAAFRKSAVSLGMTSPDGELLHGSVWPTFASGTGPGTHGVYFWTQWLAEEQRHVRNNHPAFAYEPFWSEFPAAGKRVTTIDIPYVPLVQGPGMRGVTGWGLQDEVEPVSYPGGFRREIERRFGHNPLGFDTVEPRTPAEKLNVARMLRVGLKRRTALIEGIARQDDWDLFIAVFSETHHAGHYLSMPQDLTERTTNVSAMAAILRPLDEALPRIVQAAGPNCDIVVFSLHGMRPQVDYSHFGAQVLDLLAGRQPFDAAAHPDLLRRIRNLVPDSVHRAIWNRLPARLRASRQGQLSLAGVDPATEPIFPVVHDSGAAFRLNVFGRERDGFLTDDAATEILTRLEALAAGLTVPDGRPAFEPLARAAHRWPGPRRHRLPDAFLPLNREVKSADALVAANGAVLQASQPEARNGAHTRDGFCYIRPGGPFEPLRPTLDLRDFAPTVLRLLGMPVPKRLEGTAVVA
jgi:predicted AlkP superfamily phosphohydrolase/phosphomutase